MNNRSQKIHVLSLSLALGITWGIGVLILGLIGWLLNWGIPVTKLIASVYIGFDATLMGSLIGCAIGFLDGAIGGLILGSLYNFILSKFNR